MNFVHKHPANIDRHDDQTTAERIADAAVRILGSGRFIVYQTLFVTVWISINVTGMIYSWDAYPFILLNLAFSTQAAYAAPLILLSQNRQTKFDRIAAEHDYTTNKDTFELLKRLHAEHGEMLQMLLTAKHTSIE